MATLKESLINEFEDLIEKNTKINKLITSKNLNKNQLLGIFTEMLNNKQKYVDNKDHPKTRDAATGVSNYIKQNFNEN